MALTKKQQQQVFLGAAIIVLFPYVYWNYMLKPTNERIAKTDTELASVVSKVDEMKRIATRYSSLQRDYNDLVAEVGKAEKKLPKKKNVEEIIRLVTEQATKQRVSINTFSPDAEKAQNYFVEIPFTVNFACNFHSLGKFLAAMGQQERIFAARNVQVNYTVNPKKGYTVTGTFILLAYTFKEG